VLLRPPGPWRALRGISSKSSGSRYQKAIAEVLELIREGLRR